MCGLIGYYGRDERDAVLVDAGVPALEHRGPEAHAVRGWTIGDRTFRLGHTRLRILDLSEHADQPLSDEDGRVWVAFNGEIYNHLELRSELQEDGHRFSTSTDTEVLVHLYRAVDRDARRLLERLRGMFAFALWDSVDGRLVLARDRLGIKPLYWVRHGDGIAFASETRALMASGLASDRLDEASIADYLVFGHARATSTPSADVRAMPPGHFLEWEGEGSPPGAPSAWWRLPRPPAVSDRATVREGVVALRASLRDSLARHVQADRRVGVFLSGGVDSTVVAALAAEVGSIGTLTVTWPEVGDDESASAAGIAGRLGLEHTQIPFAGADLIDVLPSAIAAMDVPTSDGLNTWIVCSAARTAGYVVALSGLGGDELFGGYPTFRQVPAAARVTEALSLIQDRGRADLARWAGRAWPGGRAARLFSAERGLPGAYASMRSIFSPAELQQQGVSLPFGPYTVAGLVSNSRLDSVGAMEFSNYLPDQLLRDADQMSMAHSLELRVPLLDDDVVAAGLALPAATRIGQIQSKQLLRDLVDVSSPPKRPFTLPFDHWMRGPLRPWLRGTLLSNQLPLATSLPYRFRRDLLAAFEGGRTHWSRPWAVAILRHWIEVRGLTL